MALVTRPENAPAIASPACPACRSESVTTTSKHPDVTSYWRCAKCGEIWNIGRRHEPPPYSRPWR